MGRVKKEDREKAIRDFCDIARRRGNVEWRSAVIEEDRKEYFRGKDLLRYCEKNPECLDPVCDTGRPVEERVEELCNAMLKMQMVVACDRFYKKPHPGRKHLVKFPRKLDARKQRSGQTWDAEAYYCWLEDRPMPPWQIALSMMMAVVVMSLCLFPLAPYKLRLAVVYFFLGLLGIIFALIAIRVVLFVLVFTLTGFEFWLFPNMLSDQVDVVGAFKPLLSLGKPEDGQSHWGTRIGGLLGTGMMIYMMYAYSPDERTIKHNLKAANENILDMFHSGTTKSIGDGTGYQPPKFGAERNIDVGSIRQHIMNEKIRKREEAAKAKKQAAEGGAPEDSESSSSEGSSDSSSTDSQESSASEAPSESEGAESAEAGSASEAEVEPAAGSASQEDAPHTEL